MNATNRKLYIYSSLFITLALNAPKLLALRRTGFIARFWHFNLTELLFQATLNFLLCMAVFYFNMNRMNLFFTRWQWKKQGWMIGINTLILGAFIITGLTVQRLFFQPSIIPDGGYAIRFIISMGLIGIELRVAWLLQQSKAREIEMEHLRNAWLKSELALLKGQLNPHFFFNALSSLSAVVRENPQQAQQYITHLSKIFRYSLQLSQTDLVTLQEEITVVQSYFQLLKMRHEEGIQLTINIDKTASRYQIPPMSLQLLVENALKHNIASVTKPLHIEISVRDKLLEVKNNLQLLLIHEPGAGIGLANLNDRYKILLQREIEIIKTTTCFIVNLPLQ